MVAASLDDASNRAWTQSGARPSRQKNQPRGKSGCGRGRQAESERGRQAASGPHRLGPARSLRSRSARAEPRHLQIGETHLGPQLELLELPDAALEVREPPGPESKLPAQRPQAPRTA